MLSLPLNRMSISLPNKVLSHHLFPPTSRKDGDKPDTSGFLGLLRRILFRVYKGGVSPVLSYNRHCIIFNCP